MNIVFFKCPHCGNVIVKLADGKVTPYCCGREMVKLEENVTDASMEAHVPVVRRLDYHTMRVDVGVTPHPMTPEHHIAFVVVVSKDKWQIRFLDPTATPEAYFLIGEEVIAVYAYCNIHGLWKA